MYALIVVNPHKPGNSPGIAEYLSLNGLGWNGSTAIPFAFWKQFKDVLLAEDLTSLVAHDMEMAATISEWEKLNYKVVPCNSQPM
jgi:hypothetical protein